MSTLTQCRLIAEDKSTVVSWIPTKHAKVGKTMTLEDRGDQRFMVTNVYDTMDEKYIKERSGDYRTQRRASDV
jgi:hypothetical protein